MADRHAHVLLRSIPLVAAGERTGALVLVRDVTEVRRRERELVTKDATIREIHHRVKNNLQTVAALLRLQARRIASPEARAALEEAVRRVGSIAIVHETLSMAADETVDFDEVVDRVCAMVAEVTPADARVVPRRTGSFGVLAAETATPLAMVLTELLQNAVEHGLGGRSRGEASLEIEAAPVTAAGWPSRSATPGRGCRRGSTRATRGGLGLQIVRTLVVGELGGSLEFAAREGGGTAVALEIPLADGVGGAGPLAQAGPVAGVAALERAALVLGQPAPDAGVLAGLQGPRQAGVDHRAAPADRAWPPRSAAGPGRCFRSGRTARGPRHGRQPRGASPCGLSLSVKPDARGRRRRVRVGWCL